MDSTVHQNIITIQDIVNIYPKDGECNLGSHLLEAEDPSYIEYINASKERLLLHITSIVEEIAKFHREQNCLQNSNQLAADKKNHITRLVTNEFSFYTTTPFTISEFQTFQEKILALASLQPENLHLVLASFAVRTPNNNVMNVVAYIECGQNPKARFIVKNYIHSTDHVYGKKHNGQIIDLRNISLKDTNNTYADSDSICFVSNLNTIPKMTIFGKEYEFSHNNLIVCKTAGKRKITVYIDVCLDYIKKVGIKNFHNMLKKAAIDTIQARRAKAFPRQYSHIVVANNLGSDCYRLEQDNVTFADPQRSFQYYKGSKRLKIGGQTFATSYVAIYTSRKEANSNYSAKYQQFINIINNHMDFNLIALKLESLPCNLTLTSAQVDAICGNWLIGAISLIVKMIKDEKTQLPFWLSCPDNIARLKKWTNNPNLRHYPMLQSLKEAIPTLQERPETARQAKLQRAAESAAQLRQAERYALYACDNLQGYHEFNPEFG